MNCVCVSVCVLCEQEIRERREKEETIYDDVNVGGTRKEKSDAKIRE